ncbi:hypothetical protein F5X97DRAFT_311338 [Nemania serpens]|nr:hypothetical protein F5X97DRAFT_311338 [Nemania serpens]
MHYMSDLGRLIASDGDSTKLEHVQLLLDFLRPRYQQHFVPAKARSLTALPTVRFDDLWVVMKPGSLACVDWYGHKIGCVVGKPTRIPPKPSQDLPEQWSIAFWFLQVHWPSDQIGCTIQAVVVDYFYGERPITSLPIQPLEYLDPMDHDKIRQRFTDRGRKVYDILSGESMYMEYDGERMENSKQSYTGRIVIGAPYNIEEAEELYPKHSWKVNWVSPSQLMKKGPDLPLSEVELTVNPKKAHRDLLTVDHFFTLSPCLSALSLPSNNWMLINVDNIRPFAGSFVVPDLHEAEIDIVKRLVDSRHRGNPPQPLSSQITGNGLIINISGPPGVGKSHMIEFISLASCRPLITLSPMDLYINNHSIGANLARWCSICSKLNAMLLIDNFDTLSLDGVSMKDVIRVLKDSKEIIFLTTTTGRSDKLLHSCITLTVLLPELDYNARNLLWSSLQNRFLSKRIQLHQSAANFLASHEAQIVKWDGHEIARCFEIATALATKRTRHGQEIRTIVEGGHFMEAMNLVHESRRRRALDERVITQHQVQMDPPPPPPPPPVIWRSDYSDLCIPGLNRVEWDAFRAASGTELFRKTKFHALDVLEGEPLIILHVDNKTRRNRQNWARRKPPSVSSVPNAAKQDEIAPKELVISGQAPLPERIRINSPAIIKAFTDISGKEITSPFLLFRPFNSLLYHEHEFRDRITQQEHVVQEWSARDSQAEEDVENEIERIGALAGLEQMRCLISFIDNEIKKKQAYIKSNHCRSIAFADVSMLFSPGGPVISEDHKQAYRVIKVSCTRHRAKDRRKEARLDFWKDESAVELDDSPVFIHCIYLDFDGKVMGPVSRLFMISKYDGEREVTSLPIFPLGYAKEVGLRDKLVKRGEIFFKVASVKHMHYTGLTLKTRDDIDSQVVIDFEEAINRHPHWRPRIMSVLNESLEKLVGRSDTSDEDVDTSDEDAALQGFLEAQKLMSKSCIKECCKREYTYYDEYIDDRRREDYIMSQMNQAAPTLTPVTIMPQDFRAIVKNNTLTDDEYLIMSYRAYGFVLRSRKWHELDMTNVFEVAALGAGEGFDELVLPRGHGDMVKSMIRQHLRDKNLSSINRDKTDIVRGKGRGLIILLHGVPGVGKTSTAECVADLFRRPLFQITSGDLGTTAKEVEDALEENFSLASRWNSILLIDEADVFLAERTKEDFVRNSLVAVFLRMMEYYAGVLFITTNRVGVFDEAFTSRIHISLYYPPLDRKSTLQIFQKNWERINKRYKTAGRDINIDTAEITEFAIDYFDSNQEGRWNGRQIRNAFQSALALAELDALGTDDFLNESDHNRPVLLGRKSFDTVATAYQNFTSYLRQVYGADFARRARENLWRFDGFGSPRLPNSLNMRLRTSEPAMPPPTAQRPPQSYAGYDRRNPQTHYPPQQPYGAENYDHSAQKPEYLPTPGPNQYPDPRERRDAGPGSGGFYQ